MKEASYRIISLQQKPWRFVSETGDQRLTSSIIRSTLVCRKLPGALSSRPKKAEEQNAWEKGSRNLRAKNMCFYLIILLFITAKSVFHEIGEKYHISIHKNTYDVYFFHGKKHIFFELKLTQIFFAPIRTSWIKFIVCNSPRKKNEFIWKKKKHLWS